MKYHDNPAATEIELLAEFLGLLTCGEAIARTVRLDLAADPNTATLFVRSKLTALADAGSAEAFDRLMQMLPPENVREIKASAARVILRRPEMFSIGGEPPRTKLRLAGGDDDSAA